MVIDIKAVVLFLPLSFLQKVMDLLDCLVKAIKFV